MPAPSSSDASTPLATDARLAPGLAEALASRVPLGVTIYHLDGEGPESLRLVYANAAADEGAGFAFSQHVGETLTDIAPAAMDTPYPALYVEVALTGETRDVGLLTYGDEHIQRATFEVRAVGLGDRHVAVVYRNVSERHAAEGALETEREFLAAVLEHVQAGIVACDEDGRLTLFNDAAKRFHGLAPDAGLDPDAWVSTYSLFRGDGSPMPPGEIPLQRAYRGERVHDVEMRIAPEGLPVRHLLASGRQLRAEDGRRSGAVVVMHDVTERREAEEARREAAVAARTAEVLRRSEARHRLLLRATASIVWAVPPSRHIAEPLPEWEAYTGQAWEEYRGDGWLAAVHPDDRAATTAAWDAAVASGEPYEVEHRLRRHDGAYRWMSAHAVPLKGADGTVEEWVGAHTDVHDQRQAEAERERQEADFRALADSIPQLVWVTDPDGHHGYYNERWYAYTGLSYEETQGEGWNAVLHPDDRERAWEVWRRSLATGEPYSIEYRFRRHDGVYRWFLGQALPRRDAAGAIVRWFGTCTDIHDRKEAERERAAAEAALRESEARWRLALDAADFGTWHVVPRAGATGARSELTPERVGLVTDDRFRTLWGVDAGAMTFAQVAERIHEDDRERVIDAVWAAMQPGTDAPYAQEYRVVQPDGSVRWVLARGRSRFDAETTSRLVSLDGIVSDITERKADEAAARQSEVQFRALIDNLPELAWTAQPDGAIDFYNRRWYAYTGTDFEAMQGWGWDKVHDPDVLPEVVARWERSIATGEPFEMEFPLRGADGAFRWFLTRVRPLRDEAGAIARWIGTNTDIDALRRTAAELRETQAALAETNRSLEYRVAERTEQLQSAFSTLDGVLNGTSDLIVAVDRERRVVAFNDAFAATFQAVYGRALEKGMDVDEALPDHPEERARARANWDRALAGEAFSVLQEEDFPGLGRRAFDLRYNPVRESGHDPTGAVCVIRDVTAQREADAALARYADELEGRNAELQQFAYVASHDLQEPLRMVTSFLQLLERRYAEQVDDTGREYIGFAVGGARRMQALLQDLLAYSRVGTHGRPFEPVDLGAAAEEVRTDLTVARAECGGRVEIGDLPEVQGDPVQLRQLLQNLVGNGLKFAAEGRAPVVRVSAERVEEDGRPAWRIAVADNGIGLEPRYEDRVFQIFQRLHAVEEYEGTGIGLAICKRIAERHGGRVWYEGRPGEGTTFYVVLADAPAR